MYALEHHKTLTLEKWSNYSRAQQVLMIANEMNRAGNLIEKNMITEVKNCYERAFELIDLTTADLKWKGRLKELRRFRELLAVLYLEKEKKAETNEKLKNALIKMNIEAYNMIS